MNNGWASNKEFFNEYIVWSLNKIKLLGYTLQILNILFDNPLEKTAASMAWNKSHFKFDLKACHTATDLTLLGVKFKFI